jgi:hypothetical protein
MEKPQTATWRSPRTSLWQNLQLPANHGRATPSAPTSRQGSHCDKAGLQGLEHFRAWGGDIPTTDIQLAAYLAEHAIALKVATLTRRLAAISIANRAQRLRSPVGSPLVRATMRGVLREHGTAQCQAAPFLREDLSVVLAAMGDRLKDLRDRVLLLIGCRRTSAFRDRCSCPQRHRASEGGDHPDHSALQD